MCEFCNGKHFESSTATSPTGDQARQTLSLEATTPQDGDLLKKYGVQVRQNGDQQEFFFRAGNEDHVVLRNSSGTSTQDVSRDLDKVIADRIGEVEKKYKVDFAKPGETVRQEFLQDKECNFTRGDMIHAVQPTLPALFGVEEGLNKSQPSQLAQDGKTGAKIYFLDRKPMPNIYGNKPVLGLYLSEDKDKRPALQITPAGMELPPTEKDVTGEPHRDVAWIAAHEVTHNSQQINWDRFPPADISERLGWKVIPLEHKGKRVYEYYLLKGKQGEFFMHGADNCHTPSTWYRVDAEGNRLNANGEKVEKVSDAAHFTNEEVMARAQVKPITYYFTNPREMLAESLTAFRMGPESRAKLLRQSPALYGVTQDYDQKEIAKFYGANYFGVGNFVRSPQGDIVPRTGRNMSVIANFERHTMFSN